MGSRVFILVVTTAFTVVAVAADDAAQVGEELKAAAVAKLEADIKKVMKQKAEAAKNKEPEAVQRLSQDLRSLRLQLRKAKAQSPEQYAEEKAALDKQVKGSDNKAGRTEDMAAFWADPRGDAPVVASRLYRDLQTFRTKPDFAQFGFGRGGPYYLWLTAAQAVAKREGPPDALEMIKKHDCTLGELVALGMEYVQSRGKETPLTMDIVRRLGPAMQTIEKEAGQLPQ